MPPLGCLRPRLGARPLRQHTRELVDASHAVPHVDASGASLAQSSKPHRRQQAAHMFHRRQGREQTYLGRQAARLAAARHRVAAGRGPEVAMWQGDHVLQTHRRKGTRARLAEGLAKHHPLAAGLLWRPRPRRRGDRPISRCNTERHPIQIKRARPRVREDAATLAHAASQLPLDEALRADRGVLEHAANLRSHLPRPCGVNLEVQCDQRTPEESGLLQRRTTIHQ
mmetsp:Transcript_3612/g.9875  ORF Transcript_3612/g.9875 Transcript_3612/m.9875 type:complete len:226 (-) Transcript_3612:419-1096(-)